MRRIDFNTTKPNFINGEFKWYIDPYFQKYIESEQAENLPSLKGLGCFVVVGRDVEDYVLIDNKQNVIDTYLYRDGFEQMEAKINIIKISKAFDDYEKSNI